MLLRIISFTLLFSHSIFALNSIYSEVEFKSLVDKTIDWRAKTIKFNLELNDPNKALLSRHITTVHEEIINEYKNIREQFWKILTIVKPIAAYAPTQIYYNSLGKNGPTKLPFDWQKSLIKETIIYDYFFVDRDVYAIDLNTLKGLETVKTMKMGLASAIILYDNYALALNQLQNTTKVRRLVNKDNLAHEGFLEELNQTFTRTNYNTLVRGYNIYVGVKSQEKAHPQIVTNFGKYLDSIVVSSYLYSIRNKVELKNIKQESWTHFFNKLVIA